MYVVYQFEPELQCKWLHVHVHTCTCRCDCNHFSQMKLIDHCNVLTFKLTLRFVILYYSSLLHLLYYDIVHCACTCTCRSTEEFTTLCGDELYLLETCLRVNPKSYGIWLHRQWIMTSSPQPDWKNEKRLCDLYLNYDERNCEYRTIIQ